MTKPEFLTGWLLLTAQPWGKTYRTGTPEAAIQIEFYYKHVCHATHQAWMAVCEEHAQGEWWPKLGDLKTSLKAIGGYQQQEQKQLTESPEYVECPPEVRAQLARLGVTL